jgi:hypothetical protein
LEFRDIQSAKLLSTLYERFDAHFPDEDRLRRWAQRRDKPSSNKAGLRERLMALSLHQYLEMFLGLRDPNLIASLLSETTGKTITEEQVGRWISAYAPKSY